MPQKVFVLNIDASFTGNGEMIPSGDYLRRTGIIANFIILTPKISPMVVFVYIVPLWRFSFPPWSKADICGEALNWPPWLSLPPPPVLNIKSDTPI